MRVYQWEKGSFSNQRLYFLAIPCYHCERPVCAKACPNSAIFKEERYGAVLLDSRKCRGSRKCWAVCPYGSITFASDQPGERGSKCTMCIDRLEEGKNPICVLSCSTRAFEFGPIDELANKFGQLRELEEMPSGDVTRPSVVFKPPQPKRQIIPWDAEKALNLWRNRVLLPSENTPHIFKNGEDVTHIHPNTIGKDHLVLKAKNVEDLMYYTTDYD